MSVPLLKHRSVAFLAALVLTGSNNLMAGSEPANSESPAGSAADESREDGEAVGLLDALLENGALTPEQHSRLVATSLASTQDTSPKVSLGSGGFKVTSADGESSIKIGGRIQVDANVHRGEGSLDPIVNEGTELRRGRFAISGTLPESLLWMAEVDFANNATAVKDFWLGKDFEGGPRVTFGHQKQPYSLGVEMSSNDLPFLERGVDNFLIIPFIDRAIGVRVEDSSDKSFYAAGLYGESVSPDGVADEGYGFAGRLVTAPILLEDEVLHLGVRGAYRVPDDESGAVRIRDETTNNSNLRVVDTGAITGVDGVMIYGVEATYANGPMSIGGEYNLLSLDRSGGDFDFSSWHVEATYALTGESRAKAYKLSAGEFKRLKAAGPSGRAWELAARLATIDLNDSGLSGGEEETLSLDLAHYYSSNLRFLLGWSNILSTSGGSAVTDEAEGIDIFSFRAQLTF